MPCCRHVEHEWVAQAVLGLERRAPWSRFDGKVGPLPRFDGPEDLHRWGGRPLPPVAAQVHGGAQDPFRGVLGPGEPDLQVVAVDDHPGVSDLVVVEQGRADLDVGQAVVGAAEPRRHGQAVPPALPPEAPVVRRRDGGVQLDGSKSESVAGGGGQRVLVHGRVSTPRGKVAGHCPGDVPVEVHPQRLGLVVHVDVR